MSDNFVREPHWVSDFLETANMNMTQFRVFQVVKRETFGWGRKEHWFTQSFLSERTNCNQRQVARELKKMVELGILLERFEGKKRFLRINPALKKNNSNNTNYDSLDISDYDYSDIVDYDSLDTHIKKEKESIKKDNNNTSILTNTMALSKYYLHEFGYEEDEHIDYVLERYYEHFEFYKEKKHPKLKEQQLLRIYNVLREMDDQHLVFYDDDSIDDIFREFFTTTPSNDHHLNHFATPGIIDILKERNK